MIFFYVSALTTVFESLKLVGIYSIDLVHLHNHKDLYCIIIFEVDSQALL